MGPNGDQFVLVIVDTVVEPEPMQDRSSSRNAKVGFVDESKGSAAAAGGGCQPPKGDDERNWISDRRRRRRRRRSRQLNFHTCRKAR